MNTRASAQEIVRTIIVEYESDPEYCFNGKRYADGRTLYTDYWSGALIAAHRWTSAEYLYCPICQTFSCTRHDAETEALIARIRRCRIVHTDILDLGHAHRSPRIDDEIFSLAIAL